MFSLPRGSRPMPSTSLLAATRVEEPTLLPEVSKLPLTPTHRAARTLVWPAWFFFLHQSDKFTHAHTKTNSSSNLLPARPNFTVLPERSYRSARFPKSTSDPGCFSHSATLFCSTMLLRSQCLLRRKRSAPSCTLCC